MDLKRFFTFLPIENGIVKLGGAEFYHAVKVTRLKEGYKFIANNNSDKDYFCTITALEKDYLLAKIDKIEINDTDDGNITLFIGICKELDTVIQKAVEMGVKKVVPFISQHTNITEINMERLTKIILESTKQCGRSNLMELSEIISFTEAVEYAKGLGNALLFYEAEREAKVKDNIKEKTMDLAVFIGSEGGFAVNEIELAKENGIKILTLGKRILRVETAVVAALALCTQAMDKL